jgi:predicted kinase
MSLDIPKCSAHYPHTTRYLSPDQLLYIGEDYVFTPERAANAWNLTYHALDEELKGWVLRGGTVIMMCGIPGSGKSTLAHRILDWHCADETPPPFVPTITLPVLIFDATFVSIARRAEFLSHIKKFIDVRVYAFFLNTPSSVCRERCLLRESETGKHIPEDSIARMEQQLEPPTQEEGFDTVWCPTSDELEAFRQLHPYAG